MPERPRVGIDATALGPQGKGIARYLDELLPRVAAFAPDATVQPVVLAGPGASIPAGAEALPVVTVRARPAIRWEQLELPRVARDERLSLVHVTTDRLPVLPSVPVVLYLFEDPRYRLALAKGSRSAKLAVADALTAVLFPRSLRKATAILTSAEATARDITQRGVPRERVTVIVPGVGDRFRPGDAAEIAAIRAELGLPEGYVLHFSSDDARDNSDVALEAYARAAAACPALPPLVIGGKVRVRQPAQQALATSLGIGERVRWVGYQPEDALLRLYRGAAVYLDPSLFEGFGLQVAEALVSGLPVVCSDTTSLPEVVGGAGLLVAPRDVAGFADALVRVTTDPALAASLRERAAARRAAFSWERCAEETVAVWERLCHGTPG